MKTEGIYIEVSDEITGFNAVYYDLAKWKDRTHLYQDKGGCGNTIKISAVHFEPLRDFLNDILAGKYEN